MAGIHYQSFFFCSFANMMFGWELKFSSKPE